MSRIGQLPIALPQGVKVTIEKNKVTVTGPKGELSRTFDPAMTISMQEKNLAVSRPNDEKKYKALHGLTRTLLANMVEGVTKGFEKRLEIVGVGYRAEKKGNNLVIHIGFAAPREVVPMPGITLDAESNIRIKVSGINKETVGEMAAKIREIHPPDRYKGKGIRYQGEVVRLKPGKAAKAIGVKA